GVALADPEDFSEPGHANPPSGASRPSEDGGSCWSGESRQCPGNTRKSRSRACSMLRLASVEGLDRAHRQGQVTCGLQAYLAGLVQQPEIPVPRDPAVDLDEIDPPVDEVLRHAPALGRGRCRKE